MSEQEVSKQEIRNALELQDNFSNAHPSQDLLEDVPTSALPEDYRDKVVLRSDRDNFYVAFSDEPDNLIPTEEGYLPNAHLKRIPAMTGPRRTGTTIKKWIDKTRETENAPN